MQPLESERSVLGAIIIENKSFWKIADLITSEHFTTDFHSTIWESIVQMMEDREPVDLVTLTAKTGKGSYINQLADFVPVASNITSYARQLDEQLTARNIDRLASDIIENKGTPSERLEFIGSRLIELQPNQSTSSATVKEAMKIVFKQIEHRHANRGQLIGVPTSIPALDSETLGFCPTDLIIVAGRPSMGKTAFALQVVGNGGRGIFFSLEMGKEQLTNRMLSSASGVELGRIRSGNLEDAHWPKLTHGAGILTQSELIINDTAGLDIYHLKSIARREHLRKPLKYILVDYLQLLSTKKKVSREQEISLYARELKGLAKELNIPVIALSQLNRGLEAREDKRPRMSDLRESGAIEQDADLILFLYRPSVYCKDCRDEKGDCGGHEKYREKSIDFYRYCELILEKHRNGEIMTAKTYFEGSTQKFTEIESRNFPEPGPATRRHQ